MSSVSVIFLCLKSDFVMYPVCVAFCGLIMFLKSLEEIIYLLTFISVIPSYFTMCEYAVCFLMCFGLYIY